jgi:hypothetical protein
MLKNKKKNELIDTLKIKELAEKQFKSLSRFGVEILGLKDREGISTRLNNKRKFTADELCLVADGLGVKVDDLRIKRQN